MLHLHRHSSFAAGLTVRTSLLLRMHPTNKFIALPDMSSINQHRPNNAIIHEIWALKIKCTRSDCTWTDTLGISDRNLIAHHAKCVFRLVNCAHGCGKQLSQRQKQQHEDNECNMRPRECYHCHAYLSWSALRAHLRKPHGCTNMTPCPNGCTGSKGRVTLINNRDESVESHRQHCPFANSLMFPVLQIRPPQ